MIITIIGRVITTNLVLLVFAMSMLVLFASTGIIQHLTAAEAIADDLGPQIGIDSKVLTGMLAVILEKGRLRRIVVYSTPWAVMSCLLGIKVALDVCDKRTSTWT